MVVLCVGITHVLYSHAVNRTGELIRVWTLMSSLVWFPMQPHQIMLVYLNREDGEGCCQSKCFFGSQHHRCSEKIQLHTCLDPVLLFQMKFNVFSGYLTECKFRISFYMLLSEAGNSYISQFSRILFACNQKQEAGIAVV